MPLPARVHQRVRRTEVDREIAGQDCAPYSAGRRRRGRRFGCERAQAALELLDAVLHRGRPPVAQQDDRDADRAARRLRTTRRPSVLASPASRRRAGPRPTGSGVRRAPSRTRRPSAPASRSAPFPSACRCRTVPRRTLSSRCGDDTATTTDGSDSVELADSVQQRDPLEIRPAAPRLGRDLAHRTCAPAPRTPRTSSPRHRRGLRRGRARLRRRTRPHPRAGVGRPMQPRRRPAAARSVSTTQSRASAGAVSTASSLRKDRTGLPGRMPRSGVRGARSRIGSPSLHSIVDGARRRPRRAPRRADRDDEERRSRRRRRARSARGAAPRPARPALAAPERARRVTPGLGARRPPAACSTRRATRWLAPMLAGAAGAILTVGVLGAIGALGRSSSDSGPTDAYPTSVADRDAPSVAGSRDDADSSVVAVGARDEAGPGGARACASATTARSSRATALVGDADERRRDHDRRAACTPRRVVGRDSTTDLVLLDRVDRIDATLPARAARRSDAPTTGRHVWVVGAPPPGRHVAVDRAAGWSSSTDSLVAEPTGPTRAGLLETDAVEPARRDRRRARSTQSGDVTGIVLSPVGDERDDLRGADRHRASTSRNELARQRRRDARGAGRQRHRRARTGRRSSQRSSPAGRRPRRGARRRRDRGRRQARGRLDRATSLGARAQHRARRGTSTIEPAPGQAAAAS